MLPLLETLLRTSSRVKSFVIIDNDPLDEETFLFKIRCELTSGQTLQIRVRAVSGSIRYSYQEVSDKPLRRWDNAPIFPISRTFHTITTTYKAILRSHR